MSISHFDPYRKSRSLFNHLIGGNNQRLRNHQAKYLSSLIISSNLGLLDRDVGRLHPSLAPMNVREWRAVHETMQ